MAPFLFVLDTGTGSTPLLVWARGVEFTVSFSAYIIHCEPSVSMRMSNLMKPTEMNSADILLWTVVAVKSTWTLCLEIIRQTREFPFWGTWFQNSSRDVATKLCAHGWLGHRSRGKELSGEKLDGGAIVSPELSETPSSCSALLARRLRVLPRLPPSASPGRNDAATTVTAGGRHVSGGSAARARRGGHHGSVRRGRNRVAVEAATAEAIARDELGRGLRDEWELGSVRPRGWRRRAQPHRLEKAGRQPPPPAHPNGAPPATGPVTR